MLRCRCWMPDSHEEADGLDVESLDVDDAATEACDKWNSLGSWSGDPFPMVIEVHVRNLATQELFVVEVEPQFDVSFWSTKMTKVAP